jgi:hypothetical protein
VTERARIWGLVVMATVAAGVGAFLALRKPTPPLPPGPCQDTAKVGIRPSVKCPPGTRVEVYSAGREGVALVKCVCPPVKK